MSWKEITSDCRPYRVSGTGNNYGVSNLCVTECKLRERERGRERESF